MSISGLAAFDSSIHLTNSWLKELTEILEWREVRGRAYLALRAVLHALRDRLIVTEVADLAAQLPMLVRGFYYEGWHPADKPLKGRTRSEFLAHVASAFPQHPPDDTAHIARAVFKLLRRRISAGEISDVKWMLPEHIRDLWD